MKTTRSLIAILGAAIPLGAAMTGSVRVEGGQVAGVPGREASIAVFKGIPFAAPPVGKLRWRAPAPVVPWQGIRKAGEFGTSCIQNIVRERKPWTYEFMAHNPVGEDCLYLNVWTPAKSAGERLPVFFWIHGGGNTEGSAAVPVYDGEGLAKKGLVVVTVNYRLGILGFFTHPELTRESGVQASGNYGLLDQIAALRWVHENIAAFGGDPGRVTVAGQSAGAGAAHNLTASPLARGLFQRAIEESGSSVASGPAGNRALADQEQDGVKFAAAKGAGSLAALRAMSWEEIVAPVPPAASGGGTAPYRFGVVVDGYSLPASVAEIFAQGRQNDVPELTGCNRGEGGATPHPEITADAFRSQARERYGDLADEFLRLYPASGDEQARTAQNESSWDQERVAMYLWAMNRGRTARAKAYTYFWDHALPGPDMEKYRAFHTSEVPYVLNSLGMSDRLFAEADRGIAEMMSSYWANFAATGDPNGKGLPYWPSVSEKPGFTMELGDKPGIIPVAGSPVKQKLFENYFANLSVQGSIGARPR